MKRYLKPSDEDRERFGLPEVCTVDFAAITVGDMADLAGRFGFDVDDWPEPLTGSLTLEQAGDPDAKPKPPPWRDHAFAWMILRQNGSTATWDDAGSFHMYKITPMPGAEAVGKDPAGEPSSPTSDASTTRRSATSTTSRRRRSTS